MARQTTPPETQRSADLRIWHLGYNHGYEDGQRDGRQEGEEALQAFLRAELDCLAQDIRLHLRHDLDTPRTCRSRSGRPMRRCGKRGMPCNGTTKGGRMGRPTKLTPAVQQALVTAVTAGVPLASACALARVDYATVCEWRHRGEGRQKHRCRTRLYADFADALRAAFAKDEARRVARIEQDGRGGVVLYRKTTTYDDGRVVTEERYTPPDWQADAWYLERARWQTWSKKERYDFHVHLHKAAAKVAADMGVSVEEVLAEAQALLLEASDGDWQP